MKNILTFVYRNSLGDCTANGLTSKHDQLPLYYGNLDQEQINALPQDSLVLIERVLFGKQANYAVPVEVYRSGRHSMAGGNFIYTSDSRFPGSAPISVHDRIENNH